ncbi:zinc-ribbon domain-containing protein [Secundilactobacillus odoratitofui]|uniref:zinc-ribbon domain-containing protein n=1 Tax=Secundilactobacillus odoratitofui TaxID=480930 RepID=UPI0006CFC999|nr:zinc ribbon domain-containing protein [Secundilactobacillus odoratitofui]
MKCPNCQKEIPANSKFCTYCGFQIPQVQATNGGGTQPVQPQFGPSQAQFDNTNQQPNLRKTTNSRLINQHNPIRQWNKQLRTLRTIGLTSYTV